MIDGTSSDDFTLGSIMASVAKGFLLFAWFASPLIGLAAEPADQPWDCAVGRGAVAKGEPRLTPKEAIALASKAARKQGINLAQFRQSSICFDASRERGQWTVFFDGRELRPGNHFLVWVQDDSGATQYMPGE